MVSWGADIVFGGHPHVVEPAEVVNKDGQNKLIIYSMGNFLSNQRLETMGDVETAQWTERGVLIDVTIEKVGRKTRIKTATAHPTWVSRTPKGTYSPEAMTCTSTRPIFWKILSRVANTATSWMRRPRREWTRHTEKWRNMSTWTGLRVERNRAWKEMWTGSRLGS